MKHRYGDLTPYTLTPLLARTKSSAPSEMNVKVRLLHLEMFFTPRRLS
jgi:hypothetical protein